MALPIDQANAESLASMLQAVAARACRGDDVVLVDTVDGYLTALACGPSCTCGPHCTCALQAMQVLYGGDWTAVLDELALTEVFKQALQLRWTEIAQALAPQRLQAELEQMQLTPLLSVFDEAARAELIEAGLGHWAETCTFPAEGVLWVQGFLRAVKEHEKAWRRIDPSSEAGRELDSMLAAIAAAAMAPGERLDEFLSQAYDEPELVDQGVLLDDALFCVQDLKLLWHRSEARPLLP